MIYTALPDIPTAVTADEAAMLERYAAMGQVLEVGSLLGFSTVVMAKVAHEVHAVDPHNGYPEGNPRDTLLPFMANLGRYHVRERVRIYMEPIERIAPLLPSGYFSFAFLDLTGHYHDTLNALNAVERLTDIIGVHDFQHPEWPGVEVATRQFLDQRPNWERYATVDRLALLMRK